MEDKSTTSVAEPAWCEAFAQSLTDHRLRASDFVSSQRTRLAELEARLEAELEQVSVALSRHDELEAPAEPAVQAALLDSKAQWLSRLQAELAEQRTDAQALLQEIRSERATLLRDSQTAEQQWEQKQAELAAAATALREQRQEITASQVRQQAEQADLDRRRKEREALQEECVAELTDLRQARARLAEQRQRVAEEFRQRRAALLAECDRRQTEAEQAAQGGQEELSRRAADVETARRQTADLQSLLAAAQGELAEQRTARLAAEQHAHTAAEGRAAVERQLQQALRRVDELVEDRDARDKRLTELKQQAAAAEDEAAAKLVQVKQQRDAAKEEAAQGETLHAQAASQVRQLTFQLTQAKEQSAAADRRMAELKQQAVAAHQEAEQKFSQLKHQSHAAGEEAARGDMVRAAAEEQLRHVQQQIHLEKQRAEEAEARLSAAQQQLQELATQPPAQSGAELAPWKERLAAAEARHKQLEQELATARQQPAEGDAADLKRRLEMALDDLRAEKTRGAELQKKLSQAPAGAAPAAGGMDWESQKRRMLAALEADGDGSPERAKEQLRIEETIRATDQALEERDREIEELKKILQEQSSNYGSMALGASAIADMLDKDEVVLQERQSLQHLQTEWRDKLRQAEIDISMERAKLARERADLEEKLRSYEQHADRPGEADGKPAVKPARGRWLTRLGLKEQGEA